MATFMKDSLRYANTSEHHIHKKIAKNYLEEDEVVHLVVKGKLKEYLLVTDKGVHIAKGDTFADKQLHPIYQVGYKDLYAFQVKNLVMGSGVLVVEGNKPPIHQNMLFPVNCISFTSGSFKFEEAAHLIDTLWSEWKANNPVPERTPKTRKEPESDKFAEIRKYKALLDDGIIKEEFEEMKRKLLS